MANTLGNYNPTIFAALALQQLEKELGRGVERVQRTEVHQVNQTRVGIGVIPGGPCSTTNSVHLAVAPGYGPRAFEVVGRCAERQNDLCFLCLGKG